MGNRTAQLNQWFESPLGKRLLLEEANILQQILPHLFGYHLLQIGSVGHGYLLENSRIMHRCVSSQNANTIIKPYTSVYGLPDALPFARDSIDVVVLPHILEFEEDPHEILREVERILIPDGYVVILGFNPISLWGIWRLILKRRENAPWCGRFLSSLRIKDWLALLGFDLKQQQTFFFALPFYNDRFRNYTKLLEKMGVHWAGNFGAVYLLVAKKRITTLTPIKYQWLAQPTLVTEAVGTQFKREDNE